MANWSGAIDEVRISATALSEARLLTQARNYLAPRDFYGVGQLNSATETNRSPVTPPTFGDATVGVSSELDPVARTFDPDISDTKTLTRSDVTGPGTVTVVSNRARLTASAAGLVRARATVTDAGGKASFAPLQWTVTGDTEPPPPSGDAVIPYPSTPGANDVVLSTNGTAIANGTALMNAYASLQPNSRLLIPARDYDTNDSAGFTFNKTSGVNQSNPIVIEVMGQAYTQARFLARIRITANDHCLIGLFVMNGAGSGTTGGGNACFGITGARSRFSRCRADQEAKVGRACFIISANDAIVDFFEAFNPFGGQSGTSDGRGICLEPTDLPLRWKIIRGYLHNFDQNSFNFHEPIQCGRGGRTWNYNCNGLLLENRISDCTNEGEAFSIKSAGNTMRGNCLINGGNNVRFTNRFGENNRWFANISQNADGFNDRGFSTLWHSNQCRSGGTLDLNAGEYTKSQWIAAAGAGGFPASTDANCYYNDCTLQLGPDFGGPSVNVDPCANPTVRAHTGTVNNINSSSADIQVNAAPPSGTAARITPVMLSVSDVGPLSNAGPT